MGVLHHLPDPVKGLRALAERLNEGGIMHIFVYSALGRREIMLMQEALALLQGGGGSDFKDGVRLGREVLAALPASSRIKSREEERWAMENERDSTFADMYLHPQEVRSPPRHPSTSFPPPALEAQARGRTGRLYRADAAGMGGHGQGPRRALRGVLKPQDVGRGAPPQGRA